MRPDVQDSADDSTAGDVLSCPQIMRICPKCEMRLAADDVGEFCPICMLRSALSGTAEIGGERSDASAPSIVDDRFEHYDLVRHEDGTPIELGRGAMGVTYKAFDVNLQCLVALKVITEKHLGDESTRLRFCARRALRPAFVIQTLPRSFTSVKAATISSMRWSLWRVRL